MKVQSENTPSIVKKWNIRAMTGGLRDEYCHFEHIHIEDDSEIERHLAAKKTIENIEDATVYSDPGNSMSAYNGESVIWLNDFKSHTMNIDEWLDVLVKVMKKTEESPVTLITTSYMDKTTFVEYIYGNSDAEADIKAQMMSIFQYGGNRKAAI